MPLFKSKSLFMPNHFFKENVPPDISDKKTISPASPASQTVSLPNISVLSSRFIDEFPPQFQQSCKVSSAPAAPKVQNSVIVPSARPSVVSVSALAPAIHKGPVARQQPPAVSAQALAVHMGPVARQQPPAVSAQALAVHKASIARQQAPAVSALALAVHNGSIARKQPPTLSAPALIGSPGNIKNKIADLKGRLATSEAENEQLLEELAELKSIIYQPTESRTAVSPVIAGSQGDKELISEITRLQRLVDQLKKDYQVTKAEADVSSEELRKFKSWYHIEKTKNIKLEKAVEFTKVDCQNLLVVRELQLAQANRFISALTSINLREPVLKRAHRLLQNGKEADAALVASIKEAAEKSDTPWATIIPAVIEEKPSDDCLDAAQRCAKLEALLLDSEKKRRFWKMKAKMNALHRETVTPSPSSLSLLLYRLESEDAQIGEAPAPIAEAKPTHPDIQHAAPPSASDKAIHASPEDAKVGEAPAPITEAQPECPDVQDVAPAPASRETDDKAIQENLDIQHVTPPSASREMDEKTVWAFPVPCPTRVASIPHPSAPSLVPAGDNLVAELAPILQECSPAEYGESSKNPSDTLSSNQPIIPAQNNPATEGDSLRKMKDVETRTVDPEEEQVVLPRPVSGIGALDTLLEASDKIDYNPYLNADPVKDHWQQPIETIPRDNAQPQEATPLKDTMPCGAALEPDRNPTKHTKNSSVLKRTVAGSLKHIRHITSSHAKANPPAQPHTPRLKSSTNGMTAQSISSVNCQPRQDPPPPPTGIRRPTVSSERKSVHFNEMINHPQQGDKQERKAPFDSPPTPMPSSIRQFSSHDTPTQKNAHRGILDQGRKAVKSLAKLIA